MTIYLRNFILSLVSMLKPFFCEILNRKISIKAAHPQRLSYKLKNTLGSSITWWHLDFVLRFGTEKWPGPWTKSFPVYLKFSNLEAIVYSLRVLIYTFHLIMIFFLLLSLMKNEFEAFYWRFIVLFFLFRPVTIIMHFLLVLRHHFIFVSRLLI